MITKFNIYPNKVYVKDLDKFFDTLEECIDFSKENPTVFFLIEENEWENEGDYEKDQYYLKNTWTVLNGELVKVK